MKESSKDHIREALLVVTDHLKKDRFLHIYEVTINKSTRELKREVKGVDFGDGKRKGTYLRHGPPGREQEGLWDHRKNANPFVYGDLLIWKSPERRNWVSRGSPHERSPAEIHVSVILKIEDQEDFVKLQVIDLASWEHARSLYTPDTV